MISNENYAIEQNETELSKRKVDYNVYKNYVMSFTKKFKYFFRRSLPPTDVRNENRKSLIESIIKHIPMAIYLKDPNDNFKIILWNKTAEKIFLLPQREILGKTTTEIWPKGLSDSDSQSEIFACQENISINIPEEVVNSQIRREIVLHTKKIPLFDEKKSNPNYLRCISEDITELKKIKLENDLAIRLEREQKASPEEVLDFMNPVISTLETSDSLHQLEEFKRNFLHFFSDLFTFKYKDNVIGIFNTTYKLAGDRLNCV